MEFEYNCILLYLLIITFIFVKHIGGTEANFLGGLSQKLHLPLYNFYTLIFINKNKNWGLSSPKAPPIYAYMEKILNLAISIYYKNILG